MDIRGRQSAVRPSGEMEGLNSALFQFIHQFSGRYFLLDDAAVFFAEYLPYLLVVGFIYFAFRRKNQRERFLIFTEGVLGVILARGIITEVVRFFYHHPRPFTALNFTPLITESSYSFPSGHAAWFFALAMAAYYYNRKLGIFYFVCAALISVARVFAGVHWPLDVLAGAVFGVLSAVFIHRLFRQTAKDIVAPVAGAETESLSAANNAGRSGGF
jgi:undecaprenyl-diphosphatase